MTCFFFNYKHSFLQAVQQLLVADPGELGLYEHWAHPCDDDVDHTSVDEGPKDECKGCHDLSVRQFAVNQLLCNNAHIELWESHCDEISLEIEAEKLKCGPALSVAVLGHFVSVILWKGVQQARWKQLEVDVVFGDTNPFVRD